MAGRGFLTAKAGAGFHFKLLYFAMLIRFNSILYIVYCIFYILYSIFYILYSIFYILYSVMLYYIPLYYVVFYYIIFVNSFSFFLLMSFLFLVFFDQGLGGFKGFIERVRGC